jgi:flagellar secretion chaperone FliS
MPAIAQNAYLESQALTADPLELIRMLYRVAREATSRAQAHLAEGRIADRSREISTALAALYELSRSLDPVRGGSLSLNLAKLYDYMQRRLIEANARQQSAPLAEVEKLLATLAEGWERMRPEHDSTPLTAELAGPLGWSEAPASEWYSSVPPAVLDPVCAYSAQSWSF